MTTSVSELDFIHENFLNSLVKSLQSTKGVIVKLWDNSRHVSESSSLSAEPSVGWLEHALSLQTTVINSE